MSAQRVTTVMLMLAVQIQWEVTLAFVMKDILAMELIARVCCIVYYLACLMVFL